MNIIRFGGEKMTKRTAKAIETKRVITQAALELFFERGYEGTTVRMIQRRANMEVGSFYYHFLSKDEALGAALDLFFEGYEENMRELVESAGCDHALTRYFEYLNLAVQDFRKKYLKTLHWSILAAIREKTLHIAREYVLTILKNYLDAGLITLGPTELETAASQLAFSIAGSILYESHAAYLSHSKALLRMIPMLLGTEA